MNNTPFITRNNDLFTMTLAGALTMVLTRYGLDLSVQAQFLMILTFGFLAGLFMNYFYQSLEWALFFCLGLQLVGLEPFVFSALKGSFQLPMLVESVLTIGKHSLFLLSSWIISIPAGYLTQKLIMNRYYEKTYF